MATPIGSLRAELSANAAAFERDLGKARKALGLTKNQFESLKSVAKAAGLAVAGTVTALAAIARSTANAGDQISKMSRKLGVSTEALSELRHAADLSGVATNTFDMALQRFTRRAAEAAAGTGEAKAALAELGIELRDQHGNLRPTEDLLGDVAEAFQGVGSQSDRVRLAFKLFDSEGVALVNMLERGRGGLDAMREEARRLGIAWTTEAGVAAEAFNDNLTRLGKALEGVKLAIGNVLIPQLNIMAQQLATFVQQDEFRLWVREITQLSSSALPLALQLAGKAFSALTIPVNALMVAILAFATAFLEVERGIISAVRAGMELLGLESLLGISTRDLADFTQDLAGWSEFYTDTMGELSQQIVRATKDLTGFGEAAKPLPAVIAKTADAVKELKAAGPILSDEDLARLRAFSEGLTGLEQQFSDLDRRELALLTPKINVSFWQEQLQAMKDSAATTWSSIQQSFSSAVAGVIQGTATMGEFFKSILNTMIQAAVNLVVQMGVNWALATVLQTTAGDAQLAAHTAVEEAKTGASAAGATARTVISIAADKVAIAGAAATLVAIAGVGHAALAVAAAVVSATAGILATIGTALVESVVGAPMAPAFFAAAVTVAIAGGFAIAAGLTLLEDAITTAGIAIGGALAVPLQEGGIIRQETLALLHPGEAVIPLDQSGRFEERPIIVHNYTVLDGRIVAKSVTEHQPGIIRRRANLRTV